MEGQRKSLESECLSSMKEKRESTETVVVREWSPTQVQCLEPGSSSAMEHLNSLKILPASLWGWVVFEHKSAEEFGQQNACVVMY